MVIIFWQQNYAQVDSSYSTTEEILEEILTETGEESDNASLYNELEQLLQNPINLNTSGISELQRIPSIDLGAAEAIISHRIKYGNFITTSELYAIKNLSDEQIKKILPFVFVSQRKDESSDKVVETDSFSGLFSNINLVFRSRISNDLQNRKGFINSRYVGTKLKSYNRLKVNYGNNIQAGFLTDKDPGENNFAGFKSYHLGLKDFSIIKSAVIGDYIIQSGQGLALWTPFGYAKGSDALYPVKRNNYGLKPYTSSTEYGFFRGAAASFDLGNFNLTGFYSDNYYDASIDAPSGKIATIVKTGLYRTQSEIEKRNAGKFKSIGGILNYNFLDNQSIGVLYYNAKYDREFLKTDVYSLHGSAFNYSSIFYSFYFDKINLFGEVTYDGKSVASINGIQMVISRDLIFSTTVRSYPRNFVSLFGYGFGEANGRTSNEVGIYTGLKLRTSLGIFNVYFDQFKFPYATFENPLPSTGNELMIYFTTKPFKKVETRLRYKHESKEVAEANLESKQLIKRLRRSGRIEIIYEPSFKLRVRGRFEYNHFLLKEINYNEEGYLIFQDVRFSPSNNLKIYGRVIFFRTDSFNSAIYEFENDLTGVFTNYAMYGEGMRWYLVLSYRILNFLILSTKYAETYKPFEKYLSSGNNEIEGNIDNRLSLQVDIKF